MGLGIGLKLKQSGRGVCGGGMVQLGPDKCFALLGPGIQKLSRNQCGQMMHFVGESHLARSRAVSLAVPLIPVFGDSNWPA